MFCKKCGKEIADNSEFCQFCGTKQNEDVNNTINNIQENQVKPQQDKKPNGCLTTIIVIIFLCFICGTFMEDTSSKLPATSTTTPSKPNLEVVEHHSCSTEYGTNAVCGTVQNNSSRNYGYAQVSVNFYDKNGNLIDSSLDNINNLGAGQKWKFQVPFLTYSNVSKYQVTGVEGW